ncbi:hypothetical protein D3C86_1982490 [compost metagenome]
MGDVLAGLCVLHRKNLTLLHHLGEILQGDIGAGAGVIQPPVGIFLDNRLAFGFRHRFASHSTNLIISRASALLPA